MHAVLIHGVVAILRCIEEMSRIRGLASGAITESIITMEI